MNVARYRVIMADPPWRYGSPRALVGTGGRGSLGGRASQLRQVDVTSHYQTMSVHEICRMPVADLADPQGCMLFLWVTNPFLCDGSGSKVLTAWGFKPKTVLTWAKTKSDGSPSMKTGHWLFARRTRPGWDVWGNQAIGSICWPEQDEESPGRGA